GPPDADRVVYLCPYRLSDREVVSLPVDIVAGHLTAVHGILRVSDELAQQLLQRHPADERRAGFAVLGDDPILRFHGHRGPDDRRLLAERGSVEADPALAFQR